MKPNDIILHSVTKISIFIIGTFAIFLFLAGHHNPGGGFIGGLVVASAIVLLYIAYDVKTVKEILPVDYKIIASCGVFLAVLTGIGSFFFEQPFLSHTFDYFDLPIFGETELATSVLFDVGVSLAVIGASMTIILTISEDE